VPSGPRRRDVGLRRELGLADAILICTGTIFGADIYIATSFAMSELGPASLVAWVLAGAVAMMMAVCMAECSSMFPRAGGPYLYESVAFGMPVACVLSWAYWAAEWAALATFPSAIAQYLLFLFPQLSLVGLVLVRTLFILAVMAVLYWGIRATRLVEDLMSIFEKTILFGFVLMALRLFSWDRLQPFAPYGWDKLGLATVRVFWAYMGFELVTMPAEEFKNPERDIPLGIVASMAIITAIYVTTNLALVGSVGASTIASSDTPIADAALIAFGPAAAALMTVAALDSMVASETGTYLGITRLAFAMSRDGFMPDAFSEVHEKHRTPHVSIIVQGAAAMVAANLFTINQLVIFSSFTILLSYTATCIAVVVLRFKMRHVERRFKVPLNVKVRGVEVPIIPIVAAGLGVWIMSNTPIEEVLAGLATLTLGLIVYVARHLKEGIKPSISGLEIPTLKALSALGRWSTIEEVASEVFDTPNLEIKQLSSVAASLERLHSRYGRVFKRTEGGTDYWLVKPKLSSKERLVLRLMGERGWGPMELDELKSRGLARYARSLVRKGVLEEVDGKLKLADEAYKALA